MKLPHMKYSDGITKNTQVKFGGYNHSLYARDGDIYDMRNVTSEHFPLICQRRKRAEAVYEPEEITLFENDLVKYSCPTNDTDGSTLRIHMNIDFGAELVSGDSINIKLGNTTYYDCVLQKWNIDSSNTANILTVFHFKEDASGKFPLADAFGDNSTNEYNDKIKITAVFSTEGHERNIVSVGTNNDDIYYATDGGAFYFNNRLCGYGLNDKEKQYADSGAYILILPDNVYVNTKEYKITVNKAITRTWNTNNKCYVSENTIEFKYGDTLKELKEYINNGKSIRVSIVFKNRKSVTVTGTVNDFRYYSSEQYVSVTFTSNIFSEIYPFRDEILTINIGGGVPELKYICACNNRFWGCDGDTIYCSAFGEPLEWFRYDASNEGNVADISWAVTPFDQSGEFCGCCVYDDTPIFFKEDRIYRVYGQNATNFNVRCDERAGLISGGEKTLDIVNDNLFYLSPTGIMRMYGNTVQEISGEFYETFVRGVSGDDGRRYFIEAENTKGEKKLFVFDTKKGIWTVEEAVGAKCFLKYKGKLYAYCEDSSLICMTPGEDMTFALSGEEMELENNFESFIEFGDYYCNSPDKKGVSKIYMRLSAESGSKVSVYINYDSERTQTGERIWNRIKELEPDIKKSVILPVIPRRCDHFRIRLEALGGFCLYSLSYEYYNGSAI